MVDFAVYTNLPLRGGFLLVRVTASPEVLVDAIGRPALARTVIIGMRFEIQLRGEMPEEEISVSLYHETLEAATVATLNPPAAVIELNEAGFETAARRMHAELGSASPTNLNTMLEIFGF
jgi:hypothetical protein